MNSSWSDGHCSILTFPWIAVKQQKMFHVSISFSFLLTIVFFKDYEMNNEYFLNIKYKLNNISKKFNMLWDT